jgi:hypothetical protein
MVSAEEARKAVQFLVDSAAEYAAARADRERCENMLRVVKALTMKASDEKSAAAQEREAYASDEYRNALDELFEATKEAERLRALREAAQARIEFWRSFNAGLRNAERGFHAAGGMT